MSKENGIQTEMTTYKLQCVVCRSESKDPANNAIVFISPKTGKAKYITIENMRCDFEKRVLTLFENSDNILAKSTNRLPSALCSVVLGDVELLDYELIYIATTYKDLPDDCKLAVWVKDLQTTLKMRVAALKYLMENNK